MGNNSRLDAAPMNILSVAAAFLLAVIGTLCVPEAGAFSTASYFPLTDNATWSYRENGAPGYSHSVIPGTVLFNGRAVKAVRSSDGTTQYWSSDSDGVLQHGEIEPQVYVPNYGYVQTTLTVDPPMPVLAPDATLNMPVQSTGRVNLNFEQVGAYELGYASSCTPLAMEQVNVPAGSFMALKVHCTMRITGQIEAQPFDSATEETMWLALNLGPVKGMSVTDGGEPEVAELSSSSLIDSSIDTLYFASRFDAAPGSLVLSDATRITGTNTSVAISIVGGEYSIDGGAYTSNPGVIRPGQEVTLRVQAAALGAAKASATVTVGNVNAKFDVYTRVPAGAPVLLYFSQPGDYIGQGQTVLLTDAQGSFTASRNGSGGASFQVRPADWSWWWNLNLGIPQGSFVGPGSFESAVRHPFNNGLSPGLDLSGSGRGCNRLTGRFEIFEAVFGPTGEVQKFAADFVQHCEGGGPALFGQVRFGSNVALDYTSALPAPFAFAEVYDAQRSTAVTSNPVVISGIQSAPVTVSGGQYSIDGGAFTSAPGTIANGQTLALRLTSSAAFGTASYAIVKVGAATATFRVSTIIGPGVDVVYLRSQSGDYIGAGADRLLYAGTEHVITAARNYHNGVSFQINGRGDTWTLDLSAGGKGVLAPGAYNNAARFAFANGLSPGLELSGAGRGCNTLEGRFDVLEATYGTGGEVLKFAANFTQFCDGGPPLVGQVRFRSDIQLDYKAPLPADFRFVDVFNAARGKAVVSDAVTISGIESAPISIRGGEYSIDGGQFTSAPGTVLNGQTVTVRVVAPDATGAATYAVVKVGFAAASFTVNTPLGRNTNALHFRSQSGDYIGQGQERLMYSGTQYAISPTSNYHNGASFIVEGSAEQWRLEFAAPGRVAIVPGAYPNAVRFPFQELAQPGLNLSGAGRGCNQLSGRFDVLEVAYGTDGIVSRFAANFEQHCEGGLPALFGRIRYNSNVPLFPPPPKGDHTGDGKVDVLWRHTARGDNAIWQMSGAAYGAGALIPGVSDINWRAVAAADFDGDGKADILWRHALGGDVAVWLMNGFALAGSALVASVSGNDWAIVGTGDFDADGKADILWRNSATGDNAIWLMNGSSLAGAAVITGVSGSQWSIAGVGDFDGDGRDDILWRNATTGETAVWLMSGYSLASSALLGAVPIEWSIAGIADHDGDGKADILWRNGTSGENAIWLMNGLAPASSALINGVPDARWAILGAGDYDGDGKADILWRNAATGENAVWLMDGYSLRSSAFIPSVADRDWAIVKH